MTEPASSRSPFLAALGGGCAVGIGALVFRGWSVEGHEVDWLPCLIAVALAWFLLRVVGQLQGGQLSRWAAIVCGLTVIAGKALASDAFGIVARSSGDPVDADLHWVYRALADWSQTPASTRYANAALVIASPFAAAMLTPLISRLAPLAESLRWPGHARATVCGDARHFETHDLSMATSTSIRLLLGLWLLFVASAYVWYGTGDRTGFRMITVPADKHHNGNTVLGYSVLIDQRPIMSETISAVEQTTWFSGGVRSDNNFRFLRAGYGFAGTQFAPFFGQRGGLIVVNYLCWGICLACVAKLAQSWFGSPFATATAVSFAAVGLGFAIHIHDTIPHLMSFAMYFAGVVLLWQTGIGQRERNWSTHLLLGISFGLMSLAYNVAQMLLLVYGLLGWRTQRWVHLALAAIITLAFRPVWRWALPAMGINVELVESQYFDVAVSRWQTYAEAGLENLLVKLAQYGVEIGTSVESPWVLWLAVAGFVLCKFPPGSRWFSIYVLAAPFLACLVFAPSATARGYIVFGASIIGYVCTGGLAAKLASGSTAWRVVTCLTVAALLGCQFYWATAHHRSWLGPSKSYFLGWDDGWASVRNAPTQVVSLAASPSVPEAFGGRGTMRDAGTVATAATKPIDRRSPILMFLNRLPFFAGCALLGCACWPSLPQRRRFVAALACWFLIGMALCSWRIREEPVVFDAAHAVTIGPRESRTLELVVSAETRTAIAKAVGRPGRQSMLAIGSYLPLRLEWMVDGQTAIPLRCDTPNQWYCEDENALKSALQQPKWSVRIHNDADTAAWVTGWQALGSPDRDWPAATGEVALPAVELRVIDASSGFPHLIAY